MTRGTRVCSILVALFVALGAFGQAMHPDARNVTSFKTGPIPGLPTCATGAVQDGDPATGPSIIYAKASAGCWIPWHWHTPTEKLMIVSGTAVIEPKGGKPARLHAGAFAVMPSKHVHRFHCPVACTLYVAADGAFDIHYVDADEKEISPDDALKAVKEKAAKP
jgi:mannose-6-phosphate isomerase-like protein (cupin superfamily)